MRIWSTVLRAYGDEVVNPPPSFRIVIVGYPTHAMVVRLVDELEKRKNDVAVVAPDLVTTEISGGETVVHPFGARDLPDVVVTGVSTDHLVSLRGIEALEASGVSVVNSPAAVLRSADKFITARSLVLAGIATPSTVVVSSDDAVRREAERFGYPVVLKAADGCEGNQVVLLREPADVEPATAGVRASLGMAPTVRSPLLVQELIVESMGRDRRMFVVDGTVVATMDRYARPSEWRSNLSQAARPVHAEATAEQSAIAVAAVGAVGLDFGTVDMMFGRQGPVVIEINPFGDVLDVAMTSGVDVIGSVADLIEIRARRSTGRSIGVRRLPDAELRALTTFCLDRWKRKVEELGAQDAPLDWPTSTDCYVESDRSYADADEDEPSASTGGAVMGCSGTG